MKKTSVKKSTCFFLFLGLLFLTPYLASAETLDEAILRSACVIGNVDIPNTLIPGEVYNISWMVQSYVDIQSRFQIKYSDGTKFEERGILYDKKQGSYSISDKQSYEYYFYIEYYVPYGKDGDARVGFHNAQSNSNYWMYGIFPTGVISRPDGTAGKQYFVTIGNNKKRTFYPDTTYNAININPKGRSLSETLDEAVLRSGCVIGDVDIPDTLSPGRTYIISWMVQSYVDIRSKFQIKYPDGTDHQEEGILDDVKEGSYYISDKQSYEYYFYCEYSVPFGKSGDVRIGFHNAQANSNKYFWMYGIFPTGIINRPYGTAGKQFYVTISDEQNSQGYASISQISTSPSNGICFDNDFKINFTLKEVRGASKTFENVAVAILDPDNNFLFDFAMYDNVTISAYGTWSRSPSNQIFYRDGRLSGNYIAVVRGKVNGEWFDFDSTGDAVHPESFYVNYCNSQNNPLNVPYIDQLDIPDIGYAACASASAAMILAYHGKIGNTKQEMITAAETIFSDTSSTSNGLLGRDKLENHLEDNWKFSTVYFDDSYWDSLYEKIKSEIDSGRPMILGSRSMTSAGHYLVVIGYEGSDYQNADLIVNDPFGRWNGYDNYSTSISGAGLKYDFTDITSSYSDGVFVIVK